MAEARSCPQPERCSKIYEHGILEGFTDLSREFALGLDEFSPIGPGPLDPHLSNLADLITDLDSAMQEPGPEPPLPSPLINDLKGLLHGELDFIDEHAPKPLDVEALCAGCKGPQIKRLVGQYAVTCGSPSLSETERAATRMVFNGSPDDPAPDPKDIFKKD